MTDDEVKERLRLKYIPHTEGFDADEFELYVDLIASRAMYTAPVDRNPGSITQEKVDAYPERYKWWHR